MLAIINQINTGSGGSRHPAFDPAIPDRFLFLDVDGDNGLSPLDVLAVINLIAAADQDEDSRLCLLAKTPDFRQPLTFKTKNQCFRT